MLSFVLVAVLCNNQFYYFPVLWPMSGNVAVDEGDILEILRAIERHAMETSPEEASKEALGVFTSLPRAQWATARQDLIQTSEANENALTLIDSALFVLVLDSYAPQTIHEAAANMLHGTNQLAAGETVQIGTCLNRWYDKLQIIVLADGTSGINFEHSSIDGHTALRFVSDVFAETVISFAESIVDVIHGRGRIQHVVEAIVDRAAVYADETDRPVLGVAPKKIIFQMTDQLRKRIYFAETALCDELNASDTYVLDFKDYGKSLIVGNKMSPDSFVQMSILLAYYKLYGKVVCMYEPVLTKAFYHGRTEAMRSATPLAKILCEVWCDPESTKEQKLSSLRAAVSEHSNLVKESAAGKGVDRHLYSLKCIAKRSGLAMPAFFDSIGWKTLNHTVLSTSNCGNPSLRLFGFGPVVSDGFGVGYIIKDQGLTYSVSSKHRQTQRYVRSLATTLKEIQILLRPLSNIQVHKKRTNLADIKDSLKDGTRTLARQESSAISEYPDIWGERSAPSTDQKVDDPPASVPTKSKPFFSVVSRQHSFDLLSKIDRHNSLVDL
jgi:carnitine O-acetyltransferase